MGALKDQLEKLSAKVDDVAADVRAKGGQVDAEDQAALDGLRSRLDSLDAQVGDADGSDAAQPQPSGDEPTGPVTV